MSIFKVFKTNTWGSVAAIATLVLTAWFFIEDTGSLSASEAAFSLAAALIAAFFADTIEFSGDL